MNRSLNLIGSSLILSTVFFTSACSRAPEASSGNEGAPKSAAPQPKSDTPETSQTSETKEKPASAPNQPAKPTGVSIPITLPILDAFFSDKTFADDLKSKLQLSDAQIAKLRAIARQDTARLRQADRGGNPENVGETVNEAGTRAAQKISDVIGSNKENELAAFVNQRWGGDASALASTKPNQVPTDTRIVVNIPAYRMDLWNNGQLVKTYRIGIGYPEFPLPIGLRAASEIIFNPTWTPPDEPWVQASNKVQPGEKVEAGDKLNPLGPLKVPIGLPSLIHGGKQPAKIGSFASHGCVGLTDSQVEDFAGRLAQLTGTSLTQSDIAQYKQQRSETKDVKLAKPIPVELRYETLVVEGGKLHIFRDVYDRGTNTEDNLRRVLAMQNINYDQLAPDQKTQITAALADMSRDATGKAVQPQDESAGASSDAGSNGGKKSTSAHVTNTIKGDKEAVIDLADLNAKGYPDPVSLDTGGAPESLNPRHVKSGETGRQSKRRRG